MRTLSETEIEQVGGAYLSAFLWGAGTGIAGNYLYDALGGYDGINAGLSSAWDSFLKYSLTPVAYSS